MPDLLLELFSEEIPAGMQARAGEDLQRLMTDGLKAAGLDFAAARNFAGPRRLTLAVEGLPEKSPDISEERKGPRVGSADKAIEGFLRGAGLNSIGEAEIVSDAKKGDFYVARVSKPGRPTADVIAELVPNVIRNFPWPKSQRWGSGRLRWVRPLHSILCLLGDEAVPFDIEGIASGDTSFGHRFMAPKPIRVRDFEDYASSLREAFVVLDAKERKAMILEQARAAAQAEGLELVEDAALLAETAGLVEWPVALMGRFDDAFLDLPPEVIITTIRKHQKCFSVRDTHPPLDGEGRPAGPGRGGNIAGTPTRPAEPPDLPRQGGGGKLVSRFILVANIEAEDGGKAIVEGNERVVRARLSDAKFFWDQDRKVRLEDRLPELEDIIFHEKLGTQAERVERLKALARELAPVVGADPEKAERAAALCKADLVTGMVGEFPDLQGLMGRYYALEQGEDASVAAAIEEHYKPVGQSDTVPSEPVSMAVALADKLDTLVGFWAIDETPTGSKDPYALRRAALGVIRIVLENELRIDLTDIISTHCDRIPGHGWAMTTFGLIDFLGDRLKVQLRDQGAKYDLVDAVFQTGMRREQMMPGMENVRDLLMIVRRVEALGRFLDTDDGANLLAGVTRAANILRIEEKKDKQAFDGAPDPALFRQDEERALAAAIDAASAEAANAVAAEDFEGAMSAIARLRAPVDAFFDHVTVNADDPSLRENRLKLLNRIRESTLAVADLSKISG